MSSTDGSKRIRNDAYYTPDRMAAVCTALFNAKYTHPLGPKSCVLEPGVGGGAFARPLALDHEVTGIDIASWSKGLQDCRTAVVGSFIDYTDGFGRERERFAFQSGRFDAVIGNPPYKHAEKFVQCALELAPVVGYLLRIAFITGKGLYERLWHPEAVTGLRYFYPMVERASFTGDGKTDSADYAFFIIERGYRGEFQGRAVSWKTYPLPPQMERLLAAP